MAHFFQDYAICLIALIETWLKMVMMIMIMMMMMNGFCGMVDWRKAINLIASRDYCQRSSPSRISDTPRAGFEPARNLNSGLVQWSCAIAITTAPQGHKEIKNK